MKVTARERRMLGFTMFAVGVLVGAELVTQAPTRVDLEISVVRVGFGVLALLLAAYGAELFVQGVRGHGRGPIGKLWWRTFRRVPAGAALLTVMATSAILSAIDPRAFDGAGMPLCVVLGVATGHLIWHELGHAVCARAVGIAPFELVAGPLTVSWVPRTKLAMNRRWLHLVIGYVQADCHGASRAARAAFWGGGLAFTALATAAAWGLTHVLAAGFAARVASLTMSMGVVIGLVNLMPLPADALGGGTDGYLLLRLAQRKPIRPR